MRLLIDHLQEEEATIKIIKLQILRTIFEKPQLREFWSDFVELLILKVLEAHIDERRDVSNNLTDVCVGFRYLIEIFLNSKVIKEAETTAAAMNVFPFDKAVDTLAPLIRTSQYHLMGAIKMLMKLVEAHPKEVTEDHLNAIMPGLIKVVSFCIC